MNRKQSLPMLIHLVLALLLLSACAGATPAPTAVALNPTTTAIPPTDTATPVPPTDTPVPPTDTPAPTDSPTSTSTLTLAPTDTSVPPTATPVPPTASPIPPTPTRRPTLKPTAIPSLLTVDWKTGVEYIDRDGSSFWCQTHNHYHNNSGVDMKFQEGKLVYPGQTPPSTYSGYGPIFGVANPDGSIKQWRVAGWYSKLFGWPNGIPGWPYDIKAGTLSDDWTWYSVAQRNGEYCRYVYVKFRGQISAAEFSPKGDLVNTNATLPPGAP